MTMRPLQESQPATASTSAANAAEKHWDWVFVVACVPVVVCVARKRRPCPSYSRRRDRIDLGLLCSLDKRGAGVIVVEQGTWYPS